MSNIENLGGNIPDPFGEEGGQMDQDQAITSTKKKKNNEIHIRVQQRNGRKSLTTVQGINPKVDLKKVVKGLKKEFCCNGTVVEDPNFGQVIQLQGDQRQNVQTFLIKEKLATKDNIKVRGTAGAAGRTA